MHKLLGCIHHHVRSHLRSNSGCNSSRSACHHSHFCSTEQLRPHPKHAILYRYITASTAPKSQVQHRHKHKEERDTTCRTTWSPGCSVLAFSSLRGKYGFRCRNLCQRAQGRASIILYMLYSTVYTVSASACYFVMAGQQTARATGSLIPRPY